MSSKETTRTKQSGAVNIQHDPTTLGQFQQGRAGALAGALEYVKDPNRQSFFQQRVGQGERAIGQLYGSQVQNLMQNMIASGMGGSARSPFAVSQLGRIGRARSGASAQNRIQNLFLSDQIRRSMLPFLAGGFQPLRTGQTSRGESESVTRRSPGALDYIGAGLGVASAFIPGAQGTGGLAGMSAVPMSPPGAMAGASPFTGQNPYVGQNAFMPPPPPGYRGPFG